MDSLYSRLFAYRERANRTPLEDFLSEAIVDLLNRMPGGEAAKFVETLFLPYKAISAWRDYRAANSAESFVWTTQQYADGYRIDIVLQDDSGSNLLAVENKISSPLRTHGANAVSDLELDAADEDTQHGNQLTTYGNWLAKHCAGGWPGAIALLTHLSAAPKDFTFGNRDKYGVPWQRTCRWCDVWKWLSEGVPQWLSEFGKVGWVELADELAKFLEERNMSAEHMTSFDLAVAEVYVSSNSSKRIETTFNAIREQLENYPSDPSFLSRRDGWEFDSNGCVIWDWFYFKSTPDWYIAWGLRFPTKSQWWRDLEPPLPSVTHAFVAFGSERRRDKPSIKTLPARLIPKGWMCERDDSMIAARPLSEFPSAPEEFPSAFASWVKVEIQAFRPALSYFLDKAKFV